MRATGADKCPEALEIRAFGQKEGTAILIRIVSKLRCFFGGPEGDRTLEPHGCEPCALPAELRAHIVRLKADFCCQSDSTLTIIAYSFEKIQSYFQFFQTFFAKTAARFRTPVLFLCKKGPTHARQLFSLLIASINAGISCFLRETTPLSQTVPACGVRPNASCTSCSAASP